MKILITSGGTAETIDSVRSITNHATGSLGKILAEEFLKAGHVVTLVTTPSAIKPEQQDRLNILSVTSVSNLLDVLPSLVSSHDVCIHSMAVSDYTPVYMTSLQEAEQTKPLSKLLTKQNTEAKISSKEDYQVLLLKKTPKVIRYIKTWNPNIILVGFKLLVNVSKKELLTVAQQSLQQNQADLMIANDLNDIRENQHHAYLLDQTSCDEAYTKTELARLIFERVTKYD